MRAKASSQKDTAVKVIPSMPWRLVEVKAFPDYRLHVKFVDGLKGEVDIAHLVKSQDAGVFAELQDTKVFNQVFLEHGAVTWPGEIDLAPDAMYASIKKTGRWVL